MTTQDYSHNKSKMAKGRHVENRYITIFQRT